MSIPLKSDVVIIGAGIVGTSAAYFLSKLGLSVVLCEKGIVAGEQSSRNWGFVRQQGRARADPRPNRGASARCRRGLGTRGRSFAGPDGRDCERPQLFAARLHDGL